MPVSPPQDGGGEGDELTLAFITGIISLLHIVKTIWTFWYENFPGSMFAPFWLLGQCLRV